MLVFSAHLFVSILLLNRLLLSRTRNLHERILAGFTVFWTAITVSSLILSSLGALRDDWLFLFLSLACILLIPQLIPHSSPRPTIETPTGQPLFLRNNVQTFFNVLLILLLLSSILLALRTNIQIADTLSIKLPNAFFYLQNGSFLPAPASSDDGRLFSTPFNGTIMWIYLIRWHQDIHLIMIFNLFCLAAIGLTTFLLCLECGASRNGAIVATLLICLSPAVFFQGSNDNDDLLSSVMGTLAGLYAIRWLKAPKWEWSVLCGLSLGLCTGSKLFTVLYIPSAVIVGLVLFQIWRSKGYIHARLRITQLAAIFASTLVLTAPMFVCQWLYNGHLTTHLLSNSNNSPFRFSILFFNLWVFCSQFLISPWFDLIWPWHTPIRINFVESFNRFFSNYLLPDVQQYWAYLPGVKILHSHLHDHTLWFGLTSTVIVLGLICAVRNPKDRYPFWISICFLGWILTFSGRTKYIEELGRYWILPISLVLPTVALFWDAKTKTSFGGRIKALIFQFSIWSLVWINLNVLFFNEYRFNIFHAIRGDAKVLKFTKELRSVLESCHSLQIARTAYGYPIYPILHWFRGKTLSYKFDMDATGPSLIPIPNEQSNPEILRRLLPIQLSGGHRGTSSLLEETSQSSRIFYQDIENICELSFSPKNDYVIFEAQTLRILSSTSLIRFRPFGAKMPRLEFAVDTTPPGSKLNWNRYDGAIDVEIPDGVAPRILVRDGVTKELVGLIRN